MFVSFPQAPLHSQPSKQTYYAANAHQAPVPVTNPAIPANSNVVAAAAGTSSMSKPAADGGNSGRATGRRKAAENARNATSTHHNPQEPGTGAQTSVWQGTISNKPHAVLMAWGEHISLELQRKRATLALKVCGKAEPEMRTVNFKAVMHMFITMPTGGLIGHGRGLGRCGRTLAGGMVAPWPTTGEALALSNQP